MNCNTTHYRANSSSVPGDPTDPTGTQYIDDSAFRPIQKYGVDIEGSAGNYIGSTLATGPGTAPGNLISGNSTGVNIVGALSINTVQGNVIGLDASEMTAVPNLEFGVAATDSASQMITYNLISANGIAGVDIVDIGSKGNVVRNNIIGSNIQNQQPGNPFATIPAVQTIMPNNGLVKLGSQQYGVVIIGASNNVVGDKKSATAPAGSGNTIGFNTKAGAYITNTDFSGKVYARPTHNTIENNTITSSGLYGILFFNSPNNLAPPYTGPGSRNFLKKSGVTPFLNFLKSVNGQAPQPLLKHSKPQSPGVRTAIRHERSGVTHTSKGHTPKGPATHHRRVKG